MRAINERGDVVEWNGQEWVSVPGAGKGAAAAPQNRPALARGAIEAGLVGAGDVFNSIGINARELFGSLTGNEAMQGRAQADRQEAAEIRARLQAENPVASRVGAMLPGLATLPLGGGVGAQIAMGALQGGIASESGDMAGDAALGGVLAGAGGLAGNMVARVQAGRAARAAERAGGAMAGTLTEAEQQVIEGARRAGMIVTPGQATGSRQARQFEAGLASNPLTSEVFGRIEQNNAQQLNRLAARAMGVEGADNVGAEVRALAEKRIGDQFKQVGTGLGAVDTTKLKKELQRLADEEATAGLPTSAAWNVLQRFTKGEAGRAKAGQTVMGVDEMAGAQLIEMRSAAASEMRAAFAANRPDKGRNLAAVVDVIDNQIHDAAKAAGRVDLVDMYGRARDQWTVLRGLDRGGSSLDGNVLPGQMSRIMGKSDKTRYWGAADDAGQSTRRGGSGVLGEDPTGDFYDALRFSASQIGRPIVGNSGTATRQAVGDILNPSGGLVGGAVNLAARGAKSLAMNPLTKAYANMSPEAAAQAAAMLRAMSEQRGGGAVGARIGRVLGLPDL
jgi:hypothetical protein